MEVEEARGCRLQFGPLDAFGEVERLGRGMQELVGQAVRKVFEHLPGNHTATDKESAMQPKKSTTIRLFDRAGQVLGDLRLPASAPLVSLEALRTLGAVRAKLLA